MHLSQLQHQCFNNLLLCTPAAVRDLPLAQWGVLVTDNAPGSSSSSAAARSATFSFHQLLHGGETSLAAEYSMPLAPPGALQSLQHAPYLCTSVLVVLLTRACFE
jgi:hypothetical protein